MVTLSLDGYKYPAKWEICDNCRDDRLNGTYDYCCPVCDGKWFVLEVDFQKLTAEEEVRYNNYMLDLSESGLELRAEQQMGY